MSDQKKNHSQQPKPTQKPSEQIRINEGLSHKRETFSTPSSPKPDGLGGLNKSFSANPLPTKPPKRD